MPGTAEAETDNAVLGIDAKRARRADAPGQGREAAFREGLREVTEARNGRSHESWSEEDLEEEPYFRLQRELGAENLLAYPRGDSFNNYVEEFFRLEHLRVRGAAAAPEASGMPDVGVGPPGVESDNQTGTQHTPGPGEDQTGTQHTHRIRGSGRCPMGRLNIGILKTGLRKRVS